jgi:hypothetical protein
MLCRKYGQELTLKYERTHLFYHPKRRQREMKKEQDDSLKDEGAFERVKGQRWYEKRMQGFFEMEIFSLPKGLL